MKLNKTYAVYQNNKPVILKEESKNIFSFNTKAGFTYVINKYK
jgi:hypothetical protein